MKRILLGIVTPLFALALGAMAQNAVGPGPHAWGDKDKDGKCDMTGQPVGQGRGKARAGMRQGGRGNQNGCCRKGQGAAAQAAPSPEPKK